MSCARQRYEWAGQVSIRIFSRKKGALYRLSYRPLPELLADSPFRDTGSQDRRDAFTLP